ncbi:MAG: hypothetical protein JKY65_12540 [Planctomycetes bacterium]|nr:hypothetical protein [Planctomycetota bacterium]
MRTPSSSPVHPPFRTQALAWCAILGASLFLLATSGPIQAQDAEPAEPAKPAKPAGPAKPAEEAKPGQADKEERRAARKKKKEENRATRKAKEEGRPLAPDAPAAQALAGTFNVPPRYASDGTVRLVYSFKDLAEKGDFLLKGFDAAEAVVGGGRGRKSRRRAARQQGKGKGKNIRFELAAGSRGALMLHKLYLEDAFTITATVHIVRGTKRSDLVFFVGKGGARFGSQPVVKRGSSFKPVAKSAVDREVFAAGEQVKVEMIGKDGVLTTKLNGVTVASTKKLRGKLDGKFGLYVSGMVIQIHQLEIKGRVDARKMKLPKK